MSVTAALLKAYFAIEGVYYKLMDGLQAIGIPVYKAFINPIEGKGVPSFPVFAVIVIAVILIILNFASPAGASSHGLEVIVTGLQGERISGARVTLSLAEKDIASASTIFGAAHFSNVPFQTLSIKVEKEGYAAYSDKVPSGVSSFNAVIELSEEEQAKREAVVPPAGNAAGQFGMYAKQ